VHDLDAELYRPNSGDLAMNGWNRHRTLPRVSLGSAASLWALLTGCGGDPTSPTDLPGGEPTAAQAATPQPELRNNQVQPEAFKREAARLDFDDEIDVLRTRFLPGFEAETATELERAAVLLATTTSASSDRPGTERALAAMRAALRDGAAGPADLDAARRTIDAMQLALDASPR
jgi:hypothetical protein